MSENNKIDEGLYSRQLYVLGHDGMQRMSTANVLIAGMRGLGVEIAKNVILSGVRSVTVQDENPVRWDDLSSQFFLNESQLGQNRAQCSLPQLSVLNPHVQVSCLTGPLDEKLLHMFQVVVLTDSSLDDQRRFGQFCHSCGIKLIVADTKGLCGQLFCDFGDKFEVLDTNGKMPESVLLDHVTQGNPGEVYCMDDKEHPFKDGDKVRFSEVQGMTELNHIGPLEIKVCTPYSFSICDTAEFSPYTRGGMATEVKQPSTFKFKPLAEALVDKELLTRTDFGKITQHNTLHLAFQALHSFVKKEGRLPLCRSQSDADALLATVRELNVSAQFPQLDEEIVRKLSRTARGDLAPVNAFIGGLAAQEVIKACSRKFTPLQQWLYFDALECLCGDEEDVTEDSFEPRGTRYDGQTAVFGSAFQQRLERLKYFLVGAGAIGCELLKNFALIGLGSGEGGQVVVTDMDSIERSNLNRQFLFRSGDIGKQKSVVAAAAARKMNPSMNITAHQNRLDPDSEKVYDSSFYAGLDGVVSALDNMDTRVYLDGRCTQHHRPMLDGGTQGTRGHTAVVVPHRTASYGRPETDSTKAFPLCTLKNFPHRIEHTLQWARDQFEGQFKQIPENVNRHLSDAGFTKQIASQGNAEAVELLEGVWSSLQDMRDGGRRPTNWEDCVSWARRKWETDYNNDIRQLLHCFPPDEKTTSDLPFWSGTKRCPHPLTFDPDNTTHMGYVLAAANLYGQIYGIAGKQDQVSVRNVLEGVCVPAFTPKSSVKIHVNDEEMERDKKQETGDSVRLEELVRTLAPFSLNSSVRPMHPIDFEKDDDNNFHMDFIVAASNLRAENYYIPAADRHESKRIAGRIIPAIATTTAAVAGLMCLELYKLVQGHKKISAYRSSYFDLAVQNFVMFQPCGPQRFTVAGKQYTPWDAFHVEGRREGQQEMTLGELIQYIKDSHSLEVCSLFYGTAFLYDASRHRGERLRQRVSDVVRSVTKAKLPPGKQMLEFTPMFVEDDVCERTPPIRYWCW